MKKLIAWLKPKTIRGKQMGAIMGTTLAALTVASFAFLISEIVEFRREMLHNLSSLAGVVGKNCATALDFDDEKDAALALEALKAEEHILRAVLYNQSGKYFGQYRRDEQVPKHFAKPNFGERPYRFRFNSVMLWEPIEWKGEMHGTIVVESDLKGFYSRIKQYGVITLIVVFSTTVAAWIVAGFLSRLFVDPVMRIVGAARSIRSSKDYTIRVRRHSNDELGSLIDDFNGMLGEVEKRDGELREVQYSLEKRVEERTHELENSVSLMSATLESTTEAILAVNFSGEITTFNEHFLQMWGVTREMVEKKSFNTLAERLATSLTQPEAILTRLDELQFEVEMETVDGRVLEMSSNPQQYFGIAIGRVWSFRDVTQRKRAEEAICNARLMAEQANRAKSEFLANMSHEIRTPMNGVIGMTQLVLDTDLTPEQREYLGTVKSSGEALMTIINDILDFSKIEAGKLQIEAAPFNLHEAVADMLKTIRLSAHQKELELICDLSPELPAGFVGDPVRLRQVLLNLLHNAIKFTSAGEVGLFIRERAVMEEAVTVEFEVTDTGIGIPADKLEHIFGAFEQADGSTTRRFGGTGLGLTISRQLVQMMGSELRVRSELGKGTSFSFMITLPRSSAVAPAPRVDKAVLRGLRALVVDDNRTNRVILEKFLLKWEMRPVLAASAAEALKILRESGRKNEDFSVVLVDCHMPEMDGFQLIERMNESPQANQPVVMMLTSDDQSISRARSKKLGLHSQLIKPVDAAELQGTILALIGGGMQGVASLKEIEEENPVTVPLRILVAEDNSVNQRLVLRMLEKMGHAAKLAEHGAAAVEAFQQERFDLILMDVQMPVMDGIEATVQIRKLEVAESMQIPILALTAHAMKRDEERCLAAGMDGVLTKPIDFKKLKATLAGFRPRELESASTVDENDEAEEANVTAEKEAPVENAEQEAEFLRELAETFMDYYPGELESLDAAIEKGDFASVQRITHSLRGAVANFDAADVIAVAQELELAARDRRTAMVSSIFNRLQIHLASFRLQLEDLVRDSMAAASGAKSKRRPGG